MNYCHQIINNGRPVLLLETIMKGGRNSTLFGISCTHVNQKKATALITGLHNIFLENRACKHLHVADTCMHVEVWKNPELQWENLPSKLMFPQSDDFPFF